MAHHSTTPDWKLFSVVQAVYRQGPPLWDIEDWVQRKAMKFTQSVQSRVPNSAKLFRQHTTKAAYAEREARWVDDEGGYRLHLLPAVDVMAEIIEDLVNGENFPAKWDRRETIAVIKGGLHLADTKLTRRQREAIHLESLIGVDRRTAARAMNVGVKCAGSHLSSGWLELPKHRANPLVMRWFVESIGGTFPTKAVKGVKEEMPKNVHMPVPAGAVEENESV
ncbi:hypothetical protein ACFZAD_03790 [Streptomyces iakyrus]|uniref:hypothetical protein n=1 Tax=Streptomyces iakyrus TaxID=68219 RepID=UPI0036E0BFC4